MNKQADKNFLIMAHRIGRVHTHTLIWNWHRMVWYLMPCLRTANSKREIIQIEITMPNKVRNTNCVVIALDSMSSDAKTKTNRTLCVNIHISILKLSLRKYESNMEIVYCRHESIPKLISLHTRSLCDILIKSDLWSVWLDVDNQIKIDSFSTFLTLSPN